MRQSLAGFAVASALVSIADARPHGTDEGPRTPPAGHVHASAVEGPGVEANRGGRELRIETSRGERRVVPPPHRPSPSGNDSLSSIHARTVIHALGTHDSRGRLVARVFSSR